MTQTLPPLFWTGVDQFNQRQFYACHDTLEELWMEALEPDKTFYQGILQIAVALYHLGNRNWQGAVTLLGEGIRRLSAYQPDYEGVDVENLIGSSAVLLKQLQEAGPENVGAIAQQLEESDNIQAAVLTYPHITTIAAREEIAEPDPVQHPAH